MKMTVCTNMLVTLGTPLEEKKTHQPSVTILSMLYMVNWRNIPTNRTLCAIREDKEGVDCSTCRLLVPLKG